MTLDKAIKDLETEYKSDFNRQIAEWLKELKDLKEHSASFQKINELAKFAIDATGQSDGYTQGMCNGIEYMRGVLTNTKCNFFDREVTE